MAGNQHEGLGDDFFEQILAVPPPYGSTGGDVGSMPPMGLQLSSTSADDRTAAAAAAAENNHMMMRVSMGMGMMPSPLALNLEQVGFFRHEDTNNNVNSTSSHNSNTSSSSSSVTIGREQVHMPSLFPPFGNLQSQQQLLRPQPPSVPTQLQQSFHNQATAGGVAPAPQPPAGRPRVRARRGQATDPHSIAERLRRERISERMKALQELVPSCNKTDRAAMLDEIVDYVKFLRLQVKVLSMSRLGGASAVAQLVADVPPSPVEGEGIEGGADQPWDKWSSDGTEQQVAKLMEEDVGAAMQFLQSKALCIMPISLASAIFRTHQPDGHSIVKPESNTPL